MHESSTTMIILTFQKNPSLMNASLACSSMNASLACSGAVGSNVGVWLAMLCLHQFSVDTTFGSVVADACKYSSKL